MLHQYKPYKTYLISLLFFLISLSGKSQERGLLLSKYYSTKDYNSGTQNWAVIQDKRGVMYFGNANGVLEYDGVSWRLINVANNSSVRSLAIDNNNVLYSGAFNEIGQLIPDYTGNLIYKSLTHLIDSQYIDFGDIWDIYCFSDTAFFLTDKYLFKYHNSKFDYIISSHERFYLSFKIDNSYYVQELGKGLLKMEHDSLVLIKNGDYFSDLKIHSIFNMNTDLIVCTRFDGLFLYSKNGQIKSFSDISEKTKNLNNYFIKHIFYHGIEISDKLFAMSTISGSILIVDKKWNVVDVINNESIGIVSPTHYLYYQKDQPLWLALANGISQVELNSPFRYWNDEKGINGVLSDVAELGNNLYVSTGSGVYYTNKNADNINYNINSFSPVKGTFEQTWGFLYFQPSFQRFEKNKKISNLTITDKTILLVASSRGLFQIIDDKSIQISDYRGIFKLHQYRKDPSKLFLGSSNGLALSSYNNSNWTNHGIQFGISDIIRDINEDSLGNLWLSISYKGLVRIKNPLDKNASNNVEFFDTSNGLPSIKSTQIFDYKNKLYFLSDMNYYTFNDEENKFNLYQTNDSTAENEAYEEFQDTISWYRLNDEIITDLYITTDVDSTTWFGTTKGAFRYIGKPDRDYFDLHPTIIRKVFTGDSILYNGTNYTKEKIDPDSNSYELFINPSPNINIGTILKYKNNSLTFHYSSPFYEEEQKNVYSYFLEGYDKNWSAWSLENKKEYTNLHEGNYKFKVKSKNIYNLENGITEYQFTILPPWYRTFAAYLSYFILSTLFIVLIVKFYTYQLIKEKDNLEKIVKQRTQEILMQNEEIMVQAEHLKDANEWISAKNIELESQKDEIEKKKDQLEKSNATKNKFFRIIAHDLRNPISTFVNSTAYVLTDLDDFSKEKTKTFLSELNKLSQTTYNLLENLLDWSSSQMGEIKFNPKAFDVVSVIKENVELIKNKLESKEIELLLFTPDKLEVFADENMIHAVIRNLISNAAKFTGNKGKIDIRCTLNKDLCFVSVSDTGIGINKDELDKLFRIDQHHTTPGTQNEKGSGLGLILCKEFIEHNGGTITVTSEPGKGSTFTFTVNIA